MTCLTHLRRVNRDLIIPVLIIVVVVVIIFSCLQFMSCRKNSVKPTNNRLSLHTKTEKSRRTAETFVGKKSTILLNQLHFLKPLDVHMKYGKKVCLQNW